jgi:putative glycoside hydrolase with GxGYxYP motif/GxGYxY motif-containing protein
MARQFLGPIVLLLGCCVAATAGCGSAPDQPSGLTPAQRCGRPSSAAPLTWTDGRYFPSFPATGYLVVLRVVTPLADQSLSWQPDWRISDSPAAMHALTLVGMQGVINRDTPCVYLDWTVPQGPPSGFWLSTLGDSVKTEAASVTGADAIDFLERNFADRFAGAVIYDPAVPDTINLATMLAGLENRLILAPQQLGQPGIPSFADTTDLRALVASQNWDTSAAGRLRLYQWVYDHLWSRLERRLIGVVSPGPPTSGPIPRTAPLVYYPLGLAARDYLVALRAPALWLHPTEPSEAALLDKFLREAPSPIPVTGAYDEFTAVAFASQHGDWQAAMTWPNVPLSAGNVTALAGVPAAVRPYAPALDPDHLLATLGTAPVATIFFSDGDSLSYQMDRGFPGSGGYAYSWDDVEGHRVAWTINAALADLAPAVWNYYVGSADQVTFVAGLAGAGYTYPQLMSSAQLGAYLDRTADYLQRTGMRVVHIYTGHLAGDTVVTYPPVARPYYDRLKASGYLGAFVGVGSPVWGLSMSYEGVPTPAVPPMGYASIDQVIADLPGRRLGDFTIRLPDWPGQLNNVGSVVADAGVPGGRAMKYAQTLSACCLVFATSPQSLPAGSYTATVALRVASNAPTAEVAAITAVNAAGTMLAQTRLHPSDFAQAGQWQSFALAFTLTAPDPGINLILEFFPGATDLYASTVRVQRPGPDPMPVFVPIFTGGLGPPKRDAAGLAEKLAAAGVVVVTPDELMAALNPEYMIGFAEPRLGAGHPALVQARSQMQAGRFLDALMTIRAALR